ncbi:MAG: hypothetical protein AAGF77_13145 [Bacteroidota bacterium]
MTASKLHAFLNESRPSKSDIENILPHILAHPELMDPLFKMILEQDAQDRFVAGWVFDHIIRKRLDYLLPIVDDFVIQLPYLTSESVIRPMAHCCQSLTEAYYKKKSLETNCKCPT